MTRNGVREEREHDLCFKEGKLWIRGPEREGGKRSLGKDGQAGIRLFHLRE